MKVIDKHGIGYIPISREPHTPVTTFAVFRNFKAHETAANLPAHGHKCKIGPSLNITISRMV